MPSRGCHPSRKARDSNPQFYFSCTTLTSTGFGDIVPIHSFTRSLANLEAIVGQLYPATLLARIVTLELQVRRHGPSGRPALREPPRPGTLPGSSNPSQPSDDLSMTSPGKADPRGGGTARRSRKRASAPPLDVPPRNPGEFLPLTTDRLALRPLVPEDAGALHRLINDWAVTRTLAAVPFPYSRELAEEWIASTRQQLEAGAAYHLAVTGREGEQEVLVGAVSLRIKSRTGWLGYWVGRRFWGHGVATESAGRLARWALANLDLDRLAANVATDNVASAAVLRRIGFRQTGEGVEAFLARGGEHPVMCFEATRDDIFGHAEAPPEADGSKPVMLVAACALIDADGRVLLARRPEGKVLAGLWEFPGGKLHPGETPEHCLIRELREELGIDVATACLAPFAFASHPYERFHLLMPLYLCRRWKGAPKPREGQALAWVRPQKLSEYPMPPADKPLIPLLRDFL
jgi:8-oxo-dGTP diphosphatase